jgi:hydroxycarboxylate dehydrogenase B
MQQDKTADRAPQRIERSELRALCRALLETAGATGAHASTVIDHLIEADALGLKSHGVMRVPQYLDDIAAGGIDPRAAPIFTRPAPARASCDGGKGFGQVVGLAMAVEAIALARSAGVAFVTGRHMGHTGRIGAYAEAIAAEAMVGVAVCSGPRSGHWVAPFGGRDGRLATNPIAYALPVKGGAPIVADFSTSVVPEGVVRALRNRGLAVPDGALRDAAGRRTTDPAVLYATPRGAIQPLGGDFGYRGTALGILVDVLAALLAGDDTDDTAREGSNLAILAIATDGAFAERAGRMSAYLHSSPPLEAARPVLLPGEREQQEAMRLGDGPITVDGPTWTTLQKVAAARGIVVPMPVTD